MVRAFRDGVHPSRCLRSANGLPTYRETGNQVRRIVPCSSRLAGIPHDHLAGTLPRQILDIPPGLAARRRSHWASGHRLLKFWPRNTAIDAPFTVVGSFNFAPTLRNLHRAIMSLRAFEEFASSVRKVTGWSEIADVDNGELSIDSLGDVTLPRRRQLEGSWKASLAMAA